MRHDGFTVITRVRDGAEHELVKLLAGIGDDVEDNGHIPFASLGTLHYASFVVVRDARGCAELVFEGNVDGTADEFLAQLVRVAPGGVDAIYRHCSGYPDVDAESQPAPVVDYLLRSTVPAKVFHVAFPGHTVGRIRDEERLRVRVEEILDELHADPAARSAPAQDIAARLRQTILADPAWEWVMRDVPEAAVSRPLPPGVAAVAALVGALAVRAPAALARVAAPAVLALAVTVRAHELLDDWRDRRRPDWRVRAGRWDDDLEVAAQRENVQLQNHFAAVTPVKRGPVRRLLLLAVLRAVAWRSARRRGPDLAGIRVIHFARWLLTDDGRLLFLTNFDGTWDAYLDEFIVRAAGGLSAVWSNTENEVGFPSTQWLRRGGATDEDRFKAFARRAQARTLVWYSAYPSLSVSEIDANADLRRCLRAPAGDAAAMRTLLAVAGGWR